MELASPMHRVTLDLELTEDEVEICRHWALAARTFEPHTPGVRVLVKLGRQLNP